MFSVLASCHAINVGEACDCADGFAARTCTDDGCGACECLPWAPEEPDPVFTAEFYVDPEGGRGDGSATDPWDLIDWDQVDQALAAGPVAVWFARGTRSDRAVEVLRTDDGPNRLVLDGWTWGDGDPASLAGVTTTEARRKRSRVTVRGFELVDTEDQGVYWSAGDGVVLEDLVVHDNGRSPAIYFDYASRSGLPSTGLVIRNNHVFDATGECIYIGGAEGGGGPSHADLTIERNLVHHCGFRSHHGDDWDGINVKDGITGVVLRDNVVFQAHWGVQLDSPVTLDGGLVHDVQAEGVMMGGVWGDGYDGTVIEDLAIVRAGEAGIYVGADEVDSRGLELQRITVDGAAAGLRFAGTAGIDGSVTDVLLTGTGAALDGWGDVALDVGACAVHGPGATAGGPLTGQADCLRAAPAYRDLESLAGADGRYFTDDDGWRPTGAALQTAASDGGPLGAR